MKCIPKRIQHEIDSHLQEHPKQSDKELLKFLLEQVHYKDPMPRTILGRYTAIKQYLKRAHDREVEGFKPPKSLIDKVVDLDTETRSKRDTFVVTPKMISNIESLLDSSDIVDEIISLMYVSGRRINEILKDVVYKKRRGKTDEVTADHLSKQRDKKKSVTITLRKMTNTDFLSKLKHLRSLTKDDSVMGLTKLVNKRLSRMDKELNTSHKLRGIYALMAWRDSGEEQNLNGFIQSVLHQSSPDASLNYSQYVFKE